MYVRTLLKVANIKISSLLNIGDFFYISRHYWTFNLIYLIGKFLHSICKNMSVKVLRFLAILCCSIDKGEGKRINNKIW